MESSDDEQFECLLCESNTPTTIFIELKKVIKDREIPLIEHILSDHIPFNIAKRVDFRTLIHSAFKYTNDIVEFQETIIEILKLLLGRGIDINVQDSNELTVLHLAVKHRLIQVINFLIKRGANLDIRDTIGNSIFHFLIKTESQKSFMKYLDSTESQPLEKKSIDFMKFLISKGLRVDYINTDGESVLHAAAKAELLYVLQFLLGIKKIKNTINAIDSKGNTVLHTIINNMKKYSNQLYSRNKNSSQIYKNYYEIAKILVSKGADTQHFNNNGMSPLLEAALNGEVSILEMFRNQCGKLRCKYKGSNLLHLYFKNIIKKNPKDCQKILDLLLNEGNDKKINEEDRKGRTPLHYAVCSSKSELVKKLLNLGADVNIKDSILGFTPLHKAAKSDCDKSLELLIEYGADVNATSKNGVTPLHLIKSKNATKILIDNGAHIDIVDDEGYLPLHKAILRENHHVIKDLLKLGADINDRTYVVHSHDYSQETVMSHLIKLKFANLHINKNLKIIILLRECLQLKEPCEKEIEKMKNFKISDSMSLYDLLHVNRNSTCTYVENKKLRQLVKSSVFQEAFPLYYELILSTYHKGVQRRKMLEEAKDPLRKLADIALPDLCLYEIFGYLGNVDLRSIIEGANDRRWL